MRGGAAPYAEALFGLAREHGDAAAIADELAALEAALPPETRTLLAHPTVWPDAARAALGTLVAHASPLVANFLRVLAHHRRMALLRDVAEAFRERLDEAEGRVRARVQSARPLDPEETGRLAAALGRRLQRDVEIAAEVRRDLIGGARVLVGDRVLDGSLEGQLAALRRRLVSAR